MPRPLTIAYLTAGGAGMFCGSCMRDNTLAAELQRLGCDVQLIPLYTPIRTDEEDVSLGKVFYGGVNVYLRETVPLLRYVPRFLLSWLDRPAVLNAVSRFAVNTSGNKLGALAVSVLRGESGGQDAEVHRLVAWLTDHLRPDIVNLSNILIAGCVPAIKRALGVSVVVTLQGDDLFLDELVEPYRSQALAEVRRLAEHADGFIVFSDFYARRMADLLQVPMNRFSRVPMGIKLDDFRKLNRQTPAQRPPTIGYLARLCPAKGLHTLIEAYLRLRQRPDTAQFRLHLAGWLPSADRPYVKEQFARLDRAGFKDSYHYSGVVDRHGKLEFLNSIDVLSVPTTYQEPKGIFVLEALASGVPVVEPSHGAFPELLAATGGGRLVPPGDVDALEQALYELLTQAEARAELGRVGRQRVLSDFGAEPMAIATMQVYRQFVGES